MQYFSFLDKIYLIVIEKIRDLYLADIHIVFHLILYLIKVWLFQTIKFVTEQTIKISDKDQNSILYLNT